MRDPYPPIGGPFQENEGKIFDSLKSVEISFRGYTSRDKHMFLTLALLIVLNVFSLFIVFNLGYVSRLVGIKISNRNMSRSIFNSSIFIVHIRKTASVFFNSILLTKVLVLIQSFLMLENWLWYMFFHFIVLTLILKCGIWSYTDSAK